MIVARTIAQLRAARDDLRGTVGLVATLGALHAGHEALLRAARAREQAVVGTIFVNRTQFDDPADYAAYPRGEAADLARFEAQGVDVAFVPRDDEIYPADFALRIELGPIASGLEGARRPGHFAGVAVVVAKLFNLTRPTRAYFGQKDWQQTRVIARLTADLNLPVELAVVPTVRDPDGLALSSRNARFSAAQRQAALSLSRGLAAARRAWECGERSPQTLADLAAAPVRAESAARLAYADVRHALTLDPVTTAAPPLAILIAADVGGIGLIDNEVLGPGLLDW